MEPIEPTESKPGFFQSALDQTRLLLKGGVIAIIILILLIPTMQVQDLVVERENRQKEAQTEMSSKWAGPQNVSGPILVLPFVAISTDRDGRNFENPHELSILPDQLRIDAAMTPQKKYRGIYKIMMYTSDQKMQGSFSIPDFAKLGVNPAAVKWQDAFVRFVVSDVKGLNDEILLNWKGKSLVLAADSEKGAEGWLRAPLALQSAEDLKNVNFDISLHINGSEELLFTPVGKTTSVRVSSAWPSPSFTGFTLPQQTKIGTQGFTANWKTSSYRRNFPQAWVDGAFKPGGRPDNVAPNDLSRSAFGASLFIPVNNYQKVLRSVKYAFLCMLLTFAAFFIIELVGRKSVHPFQYGLIGLALVLFYTLLLSISEYLGFEMAYLIATLATVGLITWFASGLLRSARLTTVLSLVLGLTYAYIYTTLQVQDYALIIGSIGLFVALAIVMHFSRKMNYSKLSKQQA